MPRRRGDRTRTSAERHAIGWLVYERRRRGVPWKELEEAFGRARESLRLDMERMRTEMGIKRTEMGIRPIATILTSDLGSSRTATGSGDDEKIPEAMATL